LLLKSDTPPLPDLRLILCGGGALDITTEQTIRQQCPNAALHQFYGAAETSFITISDTQTPSGAQGRAYPGVDLQILDDAGQTTNGIGNVWVRSPYLFEGYLPPDTSGAQRHGGYVNVGELGRLDPQGNLYLTGRRSRQVRIADQNVSPEAIEVHLQRLSGVQVCAAIPMPDRLRGQRLIAILEGPKNPTLAHTIRQSCRATFGALATPARVLFIDALPLLPSGKPDLVALTKWAEDQT
jgi:long-chain acyl-CoA synthetase